MTGQWWLKYLQGSLTHGLSITNIISTGAKTAAVLSFSWRMVARSPTIYNPEFHCDPEETRRMQLRYIIMTSLESWDCQLIPAYVYKIDCCRYVRYALSNRQHAGQVRFDLTDKNRIMTEPCEVRRAQINFSLVFRDEFHHVFREGNLVTAGIRRLNRGLGQIGYRTTRQRHLQRQAEEAVFVHAAGARGGNFRYAVRTDASQHAELPAAHV